jgi:hypothetical protein
MTSVDDLWGARSLAAYVVSLTKRSTAGARWLLPSAWRPSAHQTEASLTLRTTIEASTRVVELAA